MFTTGKIIFAVCFLITFVLFMIWSYKKDAKNHKKYYKNAAIKVAFYSTIIIVLFILIRFLTRM